MKSTSKVLTVLAVLTSVLFTNCKAQMRDTTAFQRTINVSGTAEREVEPDIIVFNITIKEYWKEEFEPGKKYEDYKTRVPMTTIEPQILDQLKKAGVKESQIKVSSIGNFYRQAGKDFLVSKTLVLTLPDLKTVDAISKTVSSRGVSNMHIAELKHSQMEEIEKEVKVEALKAAKDKAEYMLKAIGEKCGPVLTINEANNGYYQPVQMKAEFATMRSSDGSNAATELKKIKISFQVNATFAIAK
ncbi:MAG: SIMPL domain-containing protein [Bacteroidia bacterium]|nr:SIMPL domain-containing protein [Bacteroidia bacterium]